MRKVGIYRGKKITAGKINKIKSIIAHRTPNSFHRSPWFFIKNINQMAFFDEVDVEDEYLILGEDWFLCYTTSEDYLIFLEWAALDNEYNKIRQTLEMMKVFKKLLLKYRNKNFMADMRHSTSYPFYSKMKKKGYFEEISHSIDIGGCSIIQKQKIKYLIEKNRGLKNFLNSDEVKKHPEYLANIFHCLIFTVNEAFLDKNKELTKKCKI